MQKLSKIIICCCLFFFGTAGHGMAGWPWSSKALVTINGLSYTAPEYRNWWNQWKDKGSAVPEEPDDFIEWQMLVNEARLMELDQEDSYKRKLAVFLKARARMLLKYETVDSKIQISDEVVQTVFDRDYTPVYTFDIIVCKSGDKARDYYNAVQNGQVGFRDLAASLKDENDITIRKGRYFPKSMKEYGFFAAVSSLKPGETAAPIVINNTFVILNLVEKSMPDDEKSAKRKQQIRREIWKEQEAKYTAELIDRLKKKYEVRVDEEVYGAIKPDLAGPILNKPLIYTNQENIPARKLVYEIRDEYRYRKLKDVSAGEADLIKKGFLNGMIAGTLIEWESLARHYEEKDPLKDTYLFYCQLQLIKTLERESIAPAVKINEDDVVRYYEDNIDSFRHETLFSLATITDEEKIIEKIWQEIKQGQDFFATAKKYYTTIIPVQEVSASHLEPALREVLKNLAEGDVSKPILMNDHYSLVKLIGRKQSEPDPLEKVRDIISQKLRQQKFKELKQEYITKLFDNSDIEINRQEWEKLRKSLQEEGKK